MIVLDASVIIAHRDPHDVHHDRATSLLLHLVDDDFAASVITVAECLVGPERAGRRQDFETFLTQLEIAVIPIAPDAAPTLADLRARTGLKLPDCCVLAAAQQLDGRLATCDARLAKSAQRIGVEPVGPRFSAPPH